MKKDLASDKKKNYAKEFVIQNGQGVKKHFNQF